MAKSQKKFALISVSDKSNIEHIARNLEDLGYVILSTGGTAKYLKSLGVQNKSVSKFTNFEEILEGRVKTLHPKIHAGILAKSLSDLEGCSDVYDLIDIVVVNLYPFKKYLKKNNNDQIIEMIDIGGPSLLRAAGKNFKYVTPIVDIVDYKKLVKNLNQNNGKTDIIFRKKMALKVFKQTSQYDKIISNWLNEK